MQSVGKADDIHPPSVTTRHASLPVWSKANAAPLNVSKTLKLMETYGKMPLRFEPNRGQTDPAVRFLSRGTGYTLFVTANEAVFTFLDPSGALCASERGEPGTLSQEAETHPSPLGAPRQEVVRMKLLGANPHPMVSELGRLPGTATYFLGNDPKRWHTKVPTYSKVYFRNVYPGVDLVYYGDPTVPGGLEYDFVLAPGADPGSIRLSLQGGDNVRIDSHGDLVLDGRGRELRFHRPHVYQESGKLRQEVEGTYALEGPREVGFRIASYDPTRSLRIDPTLSYSTYLGGSNFDQGNSIAVDSSGNAYVTGFTSSSNYPATSGALDTSYNGSTDVFVTKLNPSGSSPVYSTYLGGSAADQGTAIAVDLSGRATIAGQTFSSNFPTAGGALQKTYGGNGDAFVARLGADGSTLDYSTYLGGSGLDQALGIALDLSDDIYVTGKTYSTDFPGLNALQVGNAGAQDAFVAELSSSGSLVYSTCLGGSGFDQGNSIAVDTAGNAYVAGSTTSTDFPLVHPIQATCASCPNVSDAFVAEIAANAAGFVYSTYLGGGGNDQGRGIAVDGVGNAYVTGSTASTDFPVTSGALQTSQLGVVNAFVTQITGGGAGFGYSTYLGGNQYSYGQSIAVLNGNAYVAGVTNSSSFPLVNAVQSSRGGVVDAFVSELNSLGSGLVFSTYLGGSSYDEANALAVDASGNTYITGNTKSTNFPLANAFQATYGGGDSDAFVAKLGVPAGPVNLAPSSLSFSGQLVGTTSAAQSVTLSNAGNTAVTISSIAITGTNSGDFAQTNNCDTSVAAGANCTINVTFTPTAGGTRTGTLTVTDNASNSPQTVSLTGTGLAPAVSLSTTSLNFGKVTVGTTSAPQTVTLTNTGAATLTIGSIAITGTNSSDFAQSNNCGNSVAPGAQCAISVTFTPSVKGPRTAAISISDNASGSPQQVSLKGNGG